MPPHDIYVEPFVGGGTLFFAKAPAEKEIINDKKSDLVNLYRNVGRVPACPVYHGRKKFDELKNKNNRSVCEFLFVNKASYGGKGASYVDGNADKVKAVLLRKRAAIYAQRLKDVKIFNKDYRAVASPYLKNRDAFIYLDPPYFEASGGIKSYAEGSTEIKPADVCGLAKRARAKVLISYNNHPEVRKSCKGLKIRKVATSYEMQRSNSGFSKKVNELLIRNF